MNKKGTTIFISFMLGVVCFLLGLSLATPLKQVIDDSRAEGQLNCTTVTAYQDKANCYVVDMFLPLIVGTLFGIAGFILSRGFL